VGVIGIISYRLRGVDGVSVEAEKWAWAVEQLGHQVRRIAGAPGEGVRVVEGLGIEPAEHVDAAGLDQALAGVDVAVVENLCSLPLNPEATRAVAEALRGRPAVLRHHDLPWHRSDTTSFGPPPSDPAWRHVTINLTHAAELAAVGIDALVLYNRFDIDPPQGDRASTRAALGFGEGERVVLQPTRALRRKNVPGGLALAEALGATYWLTAAAEDGYGAELAAVLAGSTVPVLRGQGPGTIHDAYAACDLVVLPSTWEGFGNPVIESVTHHRPLALGSYPVAREIREMGFDFLSPDDPDVVRRALDHPDGIVLESNLALARRCFDLADLPGELTPLLADLGLAPGPPAATDNLPRSGTHS